MVLQQDQRRAQYWSTYASNASPWLDPDGRQSLASLHGQHSEGFSPVHFQPDSICKPALCQAHPNSTPMTSSVLMTGDHHQHTLICSLQLRSLLFSIPSSSDNIRHM